MSRYSESNKRHDLVCTLAVRYLQRAKPLVLLELKRIAATKHPYKRLPRELDTK